MSVFISSKLLLLPKLNRNVERLVDSSSPIADKTWEGLTIPEPHAEPFDT